MNEEIKDLLNDVRQSLESYLAVQVLINSEYQDETQELLVRIQHMIGQVGSDSDIYAPMASKAMYADLMQAHAQGKTIQCKSVQSGMWRDLPEPGWNSPVESYRIKPGE